MVTYSFVDALVKAGVCGGRKNRIAIWERSEMEKDTPLPPRTEDVLGDHGSSSKHQVSPMDPASHPSV